MAGGGAAARRPGPPLPLHGRSRRQSPRHAPGQAAAEEQGFDAWWHWQAKVIPFFGTFLRDLYAIVDDVPSLYLCGQEGHRPQRFVFMHIYDHIYFMII